MILSYWILSPCNYVLLSLRLWHTHCWISLLIGCPTDRSIAPSYIVVGCCIPSYPINVFNSNLCPPKHLTLLINYNLSLPFHRQSLKLGINQDIRLTTWLHSSRVEVKPASPTATSNCLHSFTISHNDNSERIWTQDSILEVTLSITVCCSTWTFMAILQTPGSKLTFHFACEMSPSKHM